MRKGVPYPFGCSCRIPTEEGKHIFISVSPKGLRNGASRPNNDAAFGPDTEGTRTCGINEAIKFIHDQIADALEGNVSISADDTAGEVLLLPGIFFIKDSIELTQGVKLVGSGRLSTLIRLADNDFNTGMGGLIEIPANANSASVRDISIIGRRDTQYQPYNIDGIRIHGYTWRVTLENLEIVDCQGNGINMVSSDNAENSINFEPIISNVSIISCQYGITMTYCADEAIFALNIENCTEGLRYYGGNGKWFDVHIFNCPTGCRISGAPLRSVDMTLDTNAVPMIIEHIDDSISPGLVQLIHPIFVDNSGALDIRSPHVRLTCPDFIKKKIEAPVWINADYPFETDYELNAMKITGKQVSYLAKPILLTALDSTYTTNVDLPEIFRIQVTVDGITACDDICRKTGSNSWHAILTKFFPYSVNTIYKIVVYLDNNETTLGMNITNAAGAEISGNIKINIFNC